MMGGWEVFCAFGVLMVFGVLAYIPCISVLWGVACDGAGRRLTT